MVWNDCLVSMGRIVVLRYLWLWLMILLVSLDVCLVSLVSLV